MDELTMETCLFSTATQVELMRARLSFLLTCLTKQTPSYEESSKLLRAELPVMASEALLISLIESVWDTAR